MEVKSNAMQAVTHLASASAGAILSAFVRVPTDTLKHRVQAYLIPDVWRVSSNFTYCLAEGSLPSANPDLFPTLGLTPTPEKKR